MQGHRESFVGKRGVRWGSLCSLVCLPTTVVATDELNAGDTAWVLMSTALVLFMMIPSFVLLKIVDGLVGLRVHEEGEYAGLDLAEHGEVGYDL